MSRAYVIGAGLAGLVAAERLSASGRDVVLFEASPKAGGRCRSYRDDRLGRVIDNGNHLVLSANRAVLDWATRIGGREALEIGEAAYPFLDLASGERWTVRPGRGPFGALTAAARPPGVSAPVLMRDLAGLLTTSRTRTVAQAIRRGPAWHTFWDPMTRAVLNEDPEHGSAALLRAALLRSFARGSKAARPVFAPNGLGPALIDPALDLLAGRGVDIRLRSPVSGLEGGDSLRALVVGGDRHVLGAGDVAILALPPRQAASLLPGARFPEPGRAILNAHFRIGDTPLPPLLALIGGDAHWLFRRGDVVSVTVSAEEAAPLADAPREAALARLWSDVAASIAAHGGTPPSEMPPARLLRERAATFDQSPAGAAARHAPRTRWRNLLLAGDHVATGLPATLEGAVRSGLRAADLALRAR
ncbi:protoporphyrinogen oxidase [Jannaschia seosinensis]|uniref:Protoporphyrinogen oxidase n=1 Tax=Jannaschia seosinensis TaxID=313367 RepID=A0A0M7BEW2_9RHOB|nr:hydroxysqualene dehydroxylase HpnE [Jannaschia seosinensis]CUH40453.1 protoporphyrinogen oxidase [Jannaschia seosinensis]